MSSRRVLIVDDHRESADMVAAVLDIEGHRAEVAYNGGDALRADARFLPDVVLLDLTLPDMDGCRVAELLLGREASPPLVIAVSGHDEDQIGDRARAAGCARLLVKPVEVDALLAILAAAPARRS